MVQTDTSNRYSPLQEDEDEDMELEFEYDTEPDEKLLVSPTGNQTLQRTGTQKPTVEVVTVTEDVGRAESMEVEDLEENKASPMVQDTAQKNTTSEQEIADAALQDATVDYFEGLGGTTILYQ